MSYYLNVPLTDLVNYNAFGTGDVTSTLNDSWRSMTYLSSIVGLVVIGEGMPRSAVERWSVVTGGHVRSGRGGRRGRRVTAARRSAPAALRNKQRTQPAFTRRSFTWNASIT